MTARTRRAGTLRATSLRDLVLRFIVAAAGCTLLGWSTLILAHIWRYNDAGTAAYV